MRWKGYPPSHDKWVASEDLHAPDLLAEFQERNRSIRILQLDNSLQCRTTLPFTSSNISMATLTPPESTVTATNSTGSRPISDTESSTPPLYVPPPPAIAMDQSASGVRSPLPSGSNLSSPATAQLAPPSSPFQIIDNTSPLLRPPVTMSSSRSSLQRTMTFGESTQLLRALRTERDPRPLIERISRPEGQETTPSPRSPSHHNSLSAFKGSVHPQTASPTPDEIEEDLSCFPPSPNEIKGVRVEIFEATLPPPLTNQLHHCHL